MPLRGGAGRGSPPSRQPPLLPSLRGGTVPCLSAWSYSRSYPPPLAAPVRRAVCFELASQVRSLAEPLRDIDEGKICRRLAARRLSFPPRFPQMPDFAGRLFWSIDTRKDVREVQFSLLALSFRLT